MNGLLWMYLLSGFLEILGILYTAKIGWKVVRRGGLPKGIWYPKGWQVVLALVLVLSGVIVGVVGNVASLYVK